MGTLLMLLAILSAVYGHAELGGVLFVLSLLKIAKDTGREEARRERER